MGSTQEVPVHTRTSPRTDAKQLSLPLSLCVYVCVCAVCVCRHALHRLPSRRHQRGVLRITRVRCIAWLAPCGCCVDDVCIGIPSSLPLRGRVCRRVCVCQGAVDAAPDGQAVEREPQVAKRRDGDPLSSHTHIYRRVHVRVCVCLFVCLAGEVFWRGQERVPDRQHHVHTQRERDANPPTHLCVECICVRVCVCVREDRARVIGYRPGMSRETPKYIPTAHTIHPQHTHTRAPIPPLVHPSLSLFLSLCAYVCMCVCQSVQPVVQLGAAPPHRRWTARHHIHRQA